MNNINKILILIVMLGCVRVAYAQNMAPLIPTIYAKADSGKIIINWTSEAINSVDSLTGYRDFEGFRIYKSMDGGETWGGPDDRIYFNGEAKGWAPLAQFDLTVEEDSLFCLKTLDCDIEVGPTRGVRVSGIDPLAPWVDLGENTGLEYTFTDDNVYNGKEYTYAVVSYDMGLRTYELNYESVANNMGVCTASDNSESMLTEQGCCTANSGAWDSELDRCTYADCNICKWEQLFNEIKDWDVTNPDEIELFYTTIDSSLVSVSGMICDDLTGNNDGDCVGQIEGNFCNDTDNVCIISNYDIVVYDTTIVSGLPSLESSDVVELSEKIISEEISIDTLSFAVTATPGFYAENVENISFEGVENAECISGPNGCTVILQAEDQTVGNGLKSFMIVNQDDLTESVYRFEIQATELEFNATSLTGNVFEGYKTSDPSLYVYEINNSTAKEPVNVKIYEMVDDSEFSDIISDLSIDLVDHIYCNPFAGPFYDIESCKDALAELLLDLPGVEYSDAVGYEVPEYIFENFQLKFIDDLAYSSNFTDFIDGLKFRFDNSLRSYPSSGNASVNSIKYISGISIDSGIPDTLEIENDDFFSVELNYGENGGAFNKRPPYTYKIIFRETPQFPVFETAPSNVCAEAGNPGNTLLPFEVYNLTTGALVKAVHTDRGSQYQEDDDNCIDDCGDDKWCNNGECQYLKGYKDCYWGKNENIAFKYDPVNTTETLVNAVSSCGDSCSEFQWCKDDVCEDLAEYTFDLKINFETYGYGAAPYDSSLTYSTGAYVRRSAMLWKATSAISPNTEPTSWIDSNSDGSNDNPWEPIYNWKDGDEIIIEPTSWYVDGDAWIADFSQIGKKVDVVEEDLSRISVVPNPYFSHSRFDETSTSRLMWFTHLPTFCSISIYTISGELVTSFRHDDEFSGQESWDLRSGNGDEVSPGLYIYTVESGNDSPYNEFKHIGKFAIVR